MIGSGVLFPDRRLGTLVLYVAALLRCTLIPEVRSQFEALTSSDGVESIRLSVTLVHLPAGNLTHAFQLDRQGVVGSIGKVSGRRHV